MVSGWVARPESSKGVPAADCLHALRILLRACHSTRPRARASCASVVQVANLPRPTTLCYNRVWKDTAMTSDREVSKTRPVPVPIFLTANRCLPAHDRLFRLRGWITIPVVAYLHDRRPVGG
jgi:hypothetical protein